MAKLQVEKRNGLFDLKPLYEWMRNALDGIYRIEVKKVRKPRSLDQNGWLFGCIYPILLDALLEAGWEFVSVEQVHEFFKAQMTADKVVNINTIATENNIQPNLLRNWKKEFLDKASVVFNDTREDNLKEKLALERKEKAEYAKKVGQLTMQVDWLKKKSEETLGPDYESKFSPKPFED